MDVREKLVELQSIITCPNAICNFCEHFKNKDACEKHKKEVIADNMIAHGVTVQEWISVKDRLPEEEERVLIYTKTNITNYGTYTKRYGAYRKEGFICQDGFMWLNTASHWMHLPQPPKGE